MCQLVAHITPHVALETPHPVAATEVSDHQMRTDLSLKQSALQEQAIR